MVEDSSTQAEALRRILVNAGHQVISAHDGVEGLSLAIGSDPQVIVSDISMPRMDGFELARILRDSSRLSHLPIIMITSRIARACT